MFQYIARGVQKSYKVEKTAKAVEKGVAGMDRIERQKTFKEFPAKMEFLYEMLSFVRKQAEAAGFEKQQICKIELAAEEAMVNIISYAYPTNKGTISIDCDVSQPKRIQIVLKDDGLPYNPLAKAVRKPEASVDEHKVGGHGVYFIRKVMDEVKYKRENEQNILTLIKIAG